MWPPVWKFLATPLYEIKHVLLRIITEMLPTKVILKLNLNHKNTSKYQVLNLKRKQCRIVAVNLSFIEDMSWFAYRSQKSSVSTFTQDGRTWPWNDQEVKALTVFARRLSWRPRAKCLHAKLVCLDLRLLFCSESWHKRKHEVDV